MVQDTEKRRSGNLSRSPLQIVVLPAPEGAEITIRSPGVSAWIMAFKPLRLSYL